jgi:hypothetical protein
MWIIQLGGKISFFRETCMKCSNLTQTAFIRRGMAGLLVILAGTLVAPPTRAEADTSSPKKAAMVFAKAVEAGDMATVKAVSMGTDSEYALLKSVSDLSISMKKLETATVKKFGPEGKLPKEMAMDMAGDFENSEEKIDGDNATLIVKSKPDDKFPPTLKKDATGWKVDLTNLDKDPQAAETAKMLPLMIKSLDTVTAGVESGKYKTVGEAFADLGAMMAGSPPATPEPAK